MIEDNSLEELRLRPRFELILPKSADSVLNALRIAHDNYEYAFNARFVDEHIIVGMSQNDEHYWSPQVSLRIIAHEKGSMVKGIFGPKSSVWTFFAFMRFAMITVALFILMFALSQYMLDGNYKSFLLLLPILALAVMIYFIGQYGKKKAGNQMKQLKDFIFGELEKHLTV